MDPGADRQAWGAAVRLAERHRLTVYDGAYLELALQRGLPLATRGSRRGSPAYGLTVNGVSFEPAAPQLLLSDAAIEPTVVALFALPGL